jgi:acyl-CoA synthetase (AMP-forming)/AMP-acid ligase II
MEMNPPNAPDGVHTVRELVQAKADKLGEKTFIKHGQDRISYEEINAKSNSVANQLAKLGVESGDLVCVYMYNRLEYLYTFFALAKLGAVIVPIDTRFTGDTLHYVLSKTDTKVVILDEDTRSMYEQLDSDRLNISFEFYVGPKSTQYRDFERLIEGDNQKAPNVTAKGSDLCSVIFIRRYGQSAPEGVKLPQYSYINTAAEFSENILELCEDDCIFTTLPFYSCYPIQMGLTGAMLAEAKFAFEKQFVADKFWEWLRQYAATTFLYLGRMLSVLQKSDRGPEDDHNPTQYAIGYGFSTEMDSQMIEDFQERFNITVLEAYGITPCATVATYNRPDDNKLGSAGKQATHVRVEIVDEEDWILPSGEHGEIVIQPRYPNTMMQGFYDDVELTSSVTRNQWIHTNDIGYKDSEGHIYFVANKTNSINLGRVAGRISSMEIESIINNHPDVFDSVVLGVVDEQGAEEIKAVVEPEDGSDITPIDISRLCETNLSFHKLPRYIEICEELPRSSAGKIHKRDLSYTDKRKGVWDRTKGYDLDR